MSLRRVVVAQPSSLCRDGAGLLQVGVLRWLLPPRRVNLRTESGVTEVTHAAEPMMTFVIKTTFSYAHCRGPTDEMMLAPEPEGMSLDVPSELPGAGEDEIAYPSDFVPLKRMCDVLVTGHAFSRERKSHIPVRFSLGPLERSWVVAAGELTFRAPLIAARLEGPSGEKASSGPSCTPVLLEDYPLGFDFATFNTAPPEQRIDEIPRGARLVLEGLSERAERLQLSLPDRLPLLWVDTDEEREIPTEVTPDTVWIDTDRELVVVVHRGLMRIPSLDFDGVSRVTLGLARGGAEPSLNEVKRELERGVFEAAVELSDFEDAPEPPPAEASLFARYEMLERAREPSISLTTYATISAALAESREPRNDTLALHGFDETSFLIEERAWLSKMADSAMKGDPSLATEYGTLFVAAQDALAGPQEGRESIEHYVSLKVDFEDAADPNLVLTERRVTFAEWMRMDRRWTQRAMKDPGVEKAIDRQCAAYRAAKGEA